MPSSEPELVRAYASFKLWKEGQHQHRDLRMIVGHLSVLAGVETTLETRRQITDKAPALCRPPLLDYVPIASHEESCQYFEVAVVEMDGEIEDLAKDDVPVVEMDHDAVDDDDLANMTEEPLEGRTIQPMSVDENAVGDNAKDVEQRLAQVTLRHEEDAVPSPAQTSLRQFSPATCERHLRSPSWASLYGFARRSGKYLTSVWRRDRVC